MPKLCHGVVHPRPKLEKKGMAFYFLGILQWAKVKFPLATQKKPQLVLKNCPLQSFCTVNYYNIASYHILFFPQSSAWQFLKKNLAGMFRQYF